MVKTQKSVDRSPKITARFGGLFIALDLEGVTSQSRTERPFPPLLGHPLPIELTTPGAATMCKFQLFALRWANAG